MLISKFDLYKFEWLELVFENRNKGYGAYELRQHYSRTMVMAMLFTFSALAILFGGMKILQPHAPATPVVARHVIDLTPLVDKTIKKISPPVIPHHTPPRPVATVRFVPPVVTIDKNVTEQPPKIDQLTEAIGTTNTKGAKGDNIDIPIVDVGPAVGDPTEDKTVHTLNEVQIFPAPVGGEEAWSKFLNKNLRFPQEAQDAGVSGRVYVSFVVEKDGTLSNFTVERGAGYGFDEEATRVLKLAKAWKPGLQNGRPVRVKFVIPINFQFTDNSN